MNLVVVLLAAPLLFLFAEEPRYHGETVAQLIEHSRPDNALREREKAIGALGIFAREQMGWFARGKDSEAKEQARAWVTREIVPTVAALLNDENPVIRRTAANTFRNLGTAGKQAIPALTSLLADKDELVRRRAAEALEAMGQEAAGSVPALVKMVREDSAPSARKEAAAALLHISPEGSKAVSSMLDDANPDTRLAAVGALEFQAKQAHQQWAQLLKLLDDKDPRIRAIAVGTLGRARPPADKVLPAMARLLHDDNVQVRRNAIGAFMSLEQQGCDLRPALPEILKLVNDKDDSVRRSLAFMLGDMGRAAGVAFRQLDAKSDERAIASGRQFLMIEALEKLLGDEKSYVRALACDSLRKIGPDAKHAAAALKPLLKDMAVAEGEGHVCNCAGEALAAILGDKKYLEGLPPVPPDGL
jgi:HEAT repeat protein